LIKVKKKMATWFCEQLYNCNILREDGIEFLSAIRSCRKINTVRDHLIQKVMTTYRYPPREAALPAHELIRVRDCASAMINVLSERSDDRTGFSVTKALWDIARNRPRDDLKPGFYAELIHLIRGLTGRADFQFLRRPSEINRAPGRESGSIRSNELDKLWRIVEARMSTHADGLSKEAQAKRASRCKRILKVLGGINSDWNNWDWHTQNIITDTKTLSKLATVDHAQLELIDKALGGQLPFGVTPYYASLMDEEPSDNDQAIRAQVFPPADYVEHMLSHRIKQNDSCDFMMESDTSPIDRITRRYPGIVILKVINTCPQVCVYCQRNWEIDQVMATGAIAKVMEIDTAIKWIKQHPAIREVLVTGGDPFILSDEQLRSLLHNLSEVKHIDLIRIGTRTLVTLPMRITNRLSKILGRFREIGQREIAIVTHIEHPYEITLETARAVDRLRRQGISVYNQQVFTFFVSRRFESTKLRLLLRRIGIDPYYTFAPKGKEETNSYRVPIARILQEQKEEARLIPGMRRTDEAVFNVPGLGKNYLRAAQHRDLLTILPDGKRVYEFHPWEMSISVCNTYLFKDIAILDYLKRLAEFGENPEEYDTIWYFF
jgi:lysine 2,3-aminomutase